MVRLSDVVWRLSGECGDSVWRVYEMAVCREYGGCLHVMERLSGGCMRLSGGYGELGGCSEAV